METDHKSEEIRRPLDVKRSRAEQELQEDEPGGFQFAPLPKRKALPQPTPKVEEIDPAIVKRQERRMRKKAAHLLKIPGGVWVSNAEVDKALNAMGYKETRKKYPKPCPRTRPPHHSTTLVGSGLAQPR
ncbi:uncharacterized protein LOC117648195 [Thrips palmi]|uniref:Uncharacterized protein LOC117648195 n=1 Tax=Thrips palmi TaxID=161013 RepID=A0A6P8Z864_THRPL|nr:uncharacterized protein LOC117648195 [Thrips palmi]